MNIQTLNQYKSDGWLMNQKHPTLPLLIWNYTKAAQYFGFWDKITINCRGLVTDLYGNIISHGFQKFFNLEESKHTPTDYFRIYEKADGYYIGCFIYKGNLIVNSRGSFTSPYADKAKELLLSKYPDFVTKMFKSAYRFNITYCFELIGFEQIVVSYPEPDLLFTGVFNLTENHELEIGHHDRGWGGVNIRKVKTFYGLDWRNIKQLNWANAEGFVVRFSNGDRCKIKFADYIKLHYQMTDLSNRAIWKALKEGSSITSILEDVPDEFYDKVHQYENELIGRFNREKEIVECYFNYFKPLLEHNRKLFVDKVNLLLTHPYKSLVLALIDGYDISEAVWDYIEPKFKKL